MVAMHWALRPVLYGHYFIGSSQPQEEVGTLTVSSLCLRTLRLERLNSLPAVTQIDEVEFGFELRVSDSQAHANHSAMWSLLYNGSSFLIQHHLYFSCSATVVSGTSFHVATS